jgi:hypothetical protein
LPVIIGIISDFRRRKYHGHRRTVLDATDRDCTDGGQTNITELTLACPPDHRLLQEGGWKTRKRKDGRTEWIPPPHLDGGQTRVNDFHHPENYFIEPDDE